MTHKMVDNYRVFYYDTRYKKDDVIDIIFASSKQEAKERFNKSYGSYAKIKNIIKYARELRKDEYLDRTGHIKRVKNANFHTDIELYSKYHYHPHDDNDKD